MLARVLLVIGVMVFGLRGILVGAPSILGMPIFDWAVIICLTVAIPILLLQPYRAKET